MESRVSYATVGVFIIVLGAVLVAAGLWLGSDISATPMERYSVYFEESVSGLNRNASVSYRGVEVGRVHKIELAHNNPERVHLVLEVKRGTPIKTDTRAKLAPQGITGLLNIELTGGTVQAPRLERAGDEPYPVIPSTPSLISRLDQALSQGLETLDRLGRQVSEVLSDQNQASLRTTLQNLEAISSTLARNGERIERTLALTERTMAGGAEAAQALPAAVADMRKTMNRWKALADSLDETSTEVRRMSTVAAGELRDIGNDTMPQVNALLEELRLLTTSMTRLSDELRDNPRLLLFGRPSPEPGPGEED